MTDPADRRAASRARWVEALGGLLAFADDLKERTDVALSRGGLDLLDRVTYFVCFRGRRTLQACQILVQREWDDVIGNLARALIEAAIELDYLHEATTRRNKKGRPETILTPADKARLFEGQVVLFEKKHSGKLRQDHVQWYEKVLALRKEHGLSGPFWHGRKLSGSGSILEDFIREAAGDPVRTRRFKTMEDWFGILSFFEHNNPNQNAYVVKSGEGHKILETMSHPWLIETVVRAGAEICWAWGSALGIPPGELNTRLRPVQAALEADAADAGKTL